MSWRTTEPGTAVRTMPMSEWGMEMPSVSVGTVTIWETGKRESHLSLRDEEVSLFFSLSSSVWCATYSSAATSDGSKSGVVMV